MGCLAHSCTGIAVPAVGANTAAANEALRAGSSVAGYCARLLPVQEYAEIRFAGTGAGVPVCRMGQSAVGVEVTIV